MALWKRIDILSGGKYLKSLKEAANLFKWDWDTLMVPELCSCH